MLIKCNMHLTLLLQAKLSSGNLLDVAHTIASAYLVAGSGGCKNANRRRAPGLVRFASSSSGECGGDDDDDDDDDDDNDDDNDDDDDDDECSGDECGGGYSGSGGDGGGNSDSGYGCGGDDGDCDDATGRI